MKKVTKIYNVYKYEELSDGAKEKVKERFLSTRQEWDIDYFTNIAMDIIKSYFPVIDELKVQWSFSSCQGDGVNIYGKFDLQNVDGLEWLKMEVDSFELAENWRYYYSLKSQTKTETVDEIIAEFEYTSGNEIAKWQVMEIKKMVETVFKKLSEAEKKIEDCGYKFFYEVSDEEMQEYSDSCGVLYLDDGTAYRE